MSSTRKLHSYIPRSGIGEVDVICEPLTTLIQSYQASLDIGSAITDTDHQSLIVTLYLFAGDEYCNTDVLNLNPIHIFIKEIEKNQKSLTSQNNKMGLDFRIEHGYTPFTFSITSKNASKLAKAIQEQLKQGHPIPDKKYFLAKLKRQIGQDKWRDKAIRPGKDNKTPGTIRALDQVLQNNLLEDDLQFNQIAEIISLANATSSPLTSLFRLFFRDDEVKVFYAEIERDVLAIQKAEREQEQALENIVETDPVYKIVSSSISR